MLTQWLVSRGILLSGAFICAIILCGGAIHRSHAAAPTEQVVFSGTGTFDDKSPLDGTPFGFWVWCEAEGNNPYEHECNGRSIFTLKGS